jgi:acyl-ACP thioesterase
MKQIWEENLKIRYNETDINNRLKVKSIFDMLQNSATSHAEDMQIGWKNLLNTGLFWILSWIKLEIDTYPKFDDEIIIKTWLKGNYKFYALRDFLLYDKNGNLFCRATTAWLLINSKSKRITDLNNLPFEMPYFGGGHALDIVPEKILIENKKENAYMKKICYSDLDLNYHVNNAKYVEIILNIYPEKFHLENRIKSITVTYLSETKSNEELEINVNNITKDCSSQYIEAINQTTKKPVLKSLITWEKAIN